MDLSLIICTRNRSAQLEGCLTSLSQLQSSSEWELIIVDNNSTDNTQEVINRYRNRLHQNFKLITEPSPGLGKARNAGLKAASGRIIAFTDDDCYPQQDLIETYINCFNEDATLGFCGGRVLLFDKTDYPITIQESTDHQYFTSDQVVPAGTIHGANFAFLHEALTKIGGFDPLFGAGGRFSSCEDLDALALVAAEGWNGAYDPRPIVQHHHRRKTDQEVKKLYHQYDRGRGAFYTKCLLNPVTRKIYWQHWSDKILKKQRITTTARELISAAEYLYCRGFNVN